MSLLVTLLNPLVGEDLVSFEAYRTSADLNVTGNGVYYHVPYNACWFNNGGNFAVGTGTFTAPSDGMYIFTGSVQLTGITDETYALIRLTTSNNTYNGNYVPVQNFQVNGQINFQVSKVVWMDAGDTAFIAIMATGHGSNDCDVASSVAYTTFQGAKL